MLYAVVITRAIHKLNKNNAQSTSPCPISKQNKTCTGAQL